MDDSKHPQNSTKHDMKPVVYINNNQRKFEGKVYEGGYSRNIAWDQWLHRHVENLQEVVLKKGKILHNLQVYKTFLTNRNKIIFLQYPQVGVPLFYTNPAEKILSGLFFRCLRSAVRKNQVVFDICDLKYEQAIDLDYKESLALYPYEIIEKKLFSSQACYIFASYGMRDYACKKYGINASETDVCINGGIERTEGSAVPVAPDPQKINYVYAGTLDRGRQIEELIALFPEDDKHHLYLLGPSGDWIQTEKKSISYLGAVEEHEAHQFVSLCDVGFIPYDEKRMYYQLAYPTKLSFYLTAGITYISTPVQEVQRVNDKVRGGWLAPVEEWKNLIEKITPEEVMIRKKKVQAVSSQYLWDSILRRNQFLR